MTRLDDSENDLILFDRWMKTWEMVMRACINTAPEGALPRAIWRCAEYLMAGYEAS